MIDRSNSGPLTELLAPFKKRRAKYAAVPLPMQHLSRPLSPITPPLPEDPLHPLLGLPCGPLLLPNSLGYSPIPSLPTSRCNTPLQFEVARSHPLVKEHFIRRFEEAVTSTG